MGELEIALEKVSRRIAGALIEGGQIEHLGRLPRRAGRATEITYRAKAPLVQDVRRMCRHDELACVMSKVIAFDRQNVSHFANEDLLQLGVEMRFGLLYENQMERWPVLLDVHPLSMKVEQLYDHVDQVLETEPVISVGQRRRLAAILRVVERI